MIRLRRTSEWRNLLRAFSVFIDGRKVSKIRNGQAVCFAVEPGQYELFVKIDWCMSNVLTLTVPEHGTADILCGSGFAAQRPVVASLSGIKGAYVAVWPTAV